MVLINDVIDGFRLCYLCTPSVRGKKNMFVLRFVASKGAMKVFSSTNTNELHTYTMKIIIVFLYKLDYCNSNTI